MKAMSPIETISVVIPVYNEEGNLPELLRRTLESCRAMQRPFELILIDDGSSDSSVDLLESAAAQNPEVVCVLLNRNYGQHSAIMAGFAQALRRFNYHARRRFAESARRNSAHLVAKADEGFDVVGTVRLNRADSGFRKFASSLVNKVTAKATGVMMRDYGCMLRAYRRHIVEAMLQCHERSTFIPALANSFARHATEIEVSHAARASGESKYSVWNLINLQFDLLTGISTFPLRLLSINRHAGVDFRRRLRISAVNFALGFSVHVWAAQGVFTLFASAVHFRRLAVHRHGTSGRIYRAHLSGRARAPTLFRAGSERNRLAENGGERQGFVKRTDANWCRRADDARSSDDIVGHSVVA